MKVEIWSDVVCPWCYIGKRRFETALDRFEHRDEVEVVWRSFELDSTAPAMSELDVISRLAAKYRVSREEAGAMNERVTAVAEGEGLAFRLDIARPGNTFDAHRLLHLAADRGVQGEMKEGLLAAYQTRGEPIGDHLVLTAVAVAAGLDEAEVTEVLSGNAYGEDVRNDQSQAERLGVRGVPFFVVDRRYAVSGAQSADVLLEMLEAAWSDPASIAPQAEAGPTGEAWPDDACAVAPGA